jgi:serine/threonine protein kinase
LDPEEFDIDDEDEHEELVANHAGHEVDLANFLYEIGHGPKLLDYYGYLQRENDPYKGGAMYFIAMEYVPGEDVDEIRDELTQDELLSIRRQLAYILNKMAMINRGFANEDPACLRYDREADKL